MKREKTVRFWKFRLLTAILVACCLPILTAQSLPQAAAEEFRRAIQLFEQGDYQAALQHLTALEEAHPESFDIQHLLAITLDLSGKPLDANRHFQKAVALNPSSARALANLGTSFVRIGKADEAVIQFRRALDEDPDNATANFNLGTILLRERKYRQSLPHLQRAYALQPGLYENGYHLALCHFALGETEKVREVLDSLGPVPKERAEYYLILALNQRALGRTEEAQQALKEILPLLANRPEAHDEVTALLFGEGMYREAIPILERAVEKFPASDEALASLAYAKFQVGELAEARSYAERALVVKESAETHVLLGDILESAREPVAAVGHYQRAVELDPSENNLIALGFVFLSHWNWKEAGDIFSHALTRHSGSWRLRVGLGAALLGQNEHEKATQQFLQAIELVPEEPLGYQLLAQSFLEAEDSFGEAVTRFDRFYREFPDSPWATYYQALAAYRSSIRGLRELEYRENVRLLENSIRRKPDFTDAYYLLGEICFAEKEWDAAIAAYENAIRHDPEHMEAHYKLGLGLQRIGETDRAKAELARFQQLKAKKNEAMAERIAQTTKLIVEPKN